MIEDPTSYICEYGFSTPASSVAHSVGEASDIAEEIGLPVVMKIESPDIIHKTDIGGVRLDVDSLEGVRETYENIVERAQEERPDATIRGVRVEEMCRGGKEIIIGLNDDDQFGPTIMFGLGGLFTEVLKDVSFRVLPIEEGDAEEMLEEIQGQEILRGYRGEDPISKEMLIDLLMRANDLGMDLERSLVSVDLNPVMVWPDKHRVLDAKILIEESPSDRSKVQASPPNTSYLERFFDPSSVAVVGASSTEGKIGNAVMDSLANYEYEGEVFPVNPNRTEVMGRDCYDSLSELPTSVDLVVVTIGLQLVPDLIEECADLGIHNMVIVSGGGKELGGESAQIEARIAELSDCHDVRVIGPNCIGVFDGQTRLDTLFQVRERMQRPTEGHVGLLVQSGTVGVGFLEKAHELGVSKFVSYGNRADVDEADLIAHFAEDPNTSVIACYVEGLNAGRRFLQTAEKVAQETPVVVFKAGRTDQAAEAAVSHTGFFGGTYAVYKGAFTQAGLIDVDSIGEMYAACKAIVKQPAANGNNVAILSNGAGTMVQAIDLLDEYELKLPNLDPSTISHLREDFPYYFVVKNPLDLTGSASSGHYQTGISALVDDPNIDIILPWLVFQDTPLDEGIIEVLRHLTTQSDKPILCGSMGGPYSERMSETIEEMGVPVFHSIRTWLAAARSLSLVQKEE